MPAIRPTGSRTALRPRLSLSWFFGKLYTPGFGESEAEAAATQLRERMSDKPLALTAGEPLELFTVTNRSGAVVAGYVKYVRVRPQTAPNARGLFGRQTASHRPCPSLCRLRSEY